MDTSETSAVVIRTSENFKFKQKYGKYFWAALLISFFSHVFFILAMPTISPELTIHEETTMEAFDLPPEVVIPPPPKPLAKPSIPMEAEEEIDEDITIEETTPPPPDLIPEIPQVAEGGAGEEFLLVAEVWPKFRTRPPVPRMPSYIARARVDTVTRVEFYVTKNGDVDQNRTKVAASSGYPELDELALEWAKKVKFHPALNRGEPVAVRVALPVRWKTR